MLPNLRRLEALGLPEADPFSDEDALQEAQLLDLRFDVSSSTIGLLFELRTALHLSEANTALLVARRIHGLSWTTERSSLTDRHHDDGRLAWAIDHSTPSSEGRVLRLSIGLWPGGQLELSAEEAMFYTGNVPGLERIPDYAEEDEDTILANLAHWGSEFSPTAVVFFDAEGVRPCHRELVSAGDRKVRVVNQWKTAIHMSRDWQRVFWAACPGLRCV